MEYAADISDANGAAQYYDTADHSYNTVDQYYSTEQPVYSEGRPYGSTVGMCNGSRVQ